MFLEPELPGCQLPGVITMSVVSRQDALRCGADLRRIFQSALGDTRLQFLQANTYTLHRLFALPLLVAAPFVAIDDEHAHPHAVAGHLLHARPRLDLGFLDIDAARTVQ